MLTIRTFETFHNLWKCIVYKELGRQIEKRTRTSINSINSIKSISKITSLSNLTIIDNCSIFQISAQNIIDINGLTWSFSLTISLLYFLYRRRKAYVLELLLLFYIETLSKLTIYTVSFQIQGLTLKWNILTSYLISSN